MFMSKLYNVIEHYDQYGVHRLNGLKVVYILLILFLVNFLFSIPNPYFYYFYLPITALGAEMVGETLEEKYFLLFSCLIIAIVTVFLFDIFAVSPFFWIFAFFYSAFLYLVAIDNRRHTLVIVPIALSLGAYSLLYREINISFYTVLSNCLTTILSMIIIFAALVLFPRSYYFRLWLRALLLLINQTLEHLLAMQNQRRIKYDPIQGHLIHLVQYANMLPHSFPTFSILKINLLMNKLHLLVCVTEEMALIMEGERFQRFINELDIFKKAIAKEKPCTLLKTSLPILDDLIQSWNYICSKL
ncbi:phage minor tail protein [Legionella hackeliae]|nr:phage minor tail protein [Legionella hackeliae]STX48341.1 phage minor tail protein [Legionella hackeliae]